MDVDHTRLEKALRKLSARSRFCVSGELRDLIVAILWDFVDQRRSINRLYTVDEWRENHNGVLRTLATAAEWAIAEAAYEAARARDSKAALTLRTGARVIRSSEADREKEAWETPDVLPVNRPVNRM